MIFEYEKLELPFKIRYPKGFEEWIRENLPATVIYNRFDKMMHCTRCGHTEYYGDVIRKEDRVRCSCCRELLTAMPHTTPDFYDEMETVFFWKTKTSIFYAEVWAYWTHRRPGFPEEERVRIVPLSAGRFSRKGIESYERHSYYMRSLSGWQLQMIKQEKPHLVGRAYQNITPKSLEPYYGWILYPNSEEVLANTFLKVSSFGNYKQPECLIKELALHTKYPSAEYLVKAGLQEFIDAAITKYKSTYIRPNWRAKTVHGFLRMKAQDVDKLKAWDKFNMRDIAYYRKILDYRKKPKLEDLEMVSDWIWLSDLYKRSMKEDPVKRARYLEKQYAKGRFKERYVLKHILDDYRKISVELGYPLDDDYYRYPKNIKEAHDAVVVEHRAKMEADRIAAEEKNKKAKEAEEREFQKKILPKLQRYDIHDDKYLIRALTSYTDFKEEGIRNHNCVGSYVTRAFRGEAKVFVLRKVDDPHKSFVTIELALDEKSIKQCYGKGNTIPDDDVKAWVNEWLHTVVMKRKKAAVKAASNEGRQQILCPAM